MIDAERFEAFVRAYQDQVYATACRLLGNPVEAEDVAQTVFLKAFERFGAIADSASAGAWLTAVTRNACLNHLSRYRGRWQFFSELTRPGDEEAYEATLPAAADPGPAADDTERRDRLEQALRRLPDAQRVPLVLFHFENVSYQEIADLLGVSLSKVKTDIHRGRAALKKHLSASHGPR